MAVLGLTEDDFESEPVEVWPENWGAFRAFEALGGQWRFRPNGMGPGVPISIDCTAIPAVFELQGVPRSDWPQMFEDLRVMESAALQAMRE